MTTEMYLDVDSPIGAIVVGVYRGRSQASLVERQAECAAKILGSSQSASGECID